MHVIKNAPRKQGVFLIMDIKTTAMGGGQD